MKTDKNLKQLVFLVLISFITYFSVFYYYSGVSGGDIAIGISTFFLNVLLLILFVLLFKKASTLITEQLVVLFLIIFLIEIWILNKYGYSINSYFQKLKN